MVIAFGWGFINPANHTPFIPPPTTYVDAGRGDARVRRRHGHSRRGRRRVLRVHRVRRGVDGRAGDEESRSATCRSASSARWSSARPLRPVLVCAERHRDGRRFPDRRPGSVGRLRDHEVHDRLRVAVEARDRRDSRRILVGHPRDAARTVARVLRDEPGRPRAEGLLGRASALQDAVEVEHAVLRLHRRSLPRSSPATSSAR